MAISHESNEIVDKDTGDGSVLIGTGVEFKGELSVPNRATVNGIFEGQLKARELVVGKTGKVAGEIEVQDAEICGQVENTIAVGNKLTLRSTGSISGTVTYSNIMVEEGGLLAGQINKIDQDEETVIRLQQSSEQASQQRPSPADQSQEHTSQQQAHRKA